MVWRPRAARRGRAVGPGHGPRVSATRRPRRAGGQRGSRLSARAPGPGSSPCTRPGGMGLGPRWAPRALGVEKGGEDKGQEGAETFPWRLRGREGRPGFPARAALWRRRKGRPWALPVPTVWTPGAGRPRPGCWPGRAKVRGSQRSPPREGRQGPGAPDTLPDCWAGCPRATSVGVLEAGEGSGLRVRSARAGFPLPAPGTESKLFREGGIRVCTQNKVTRLCRESMLKKPLWFEPHNWFKNMERVNVFR